MVRCAALASLLAVIAGVGPSRGATIDASDQQDIMLIQDLRSTNTLAYVDGTTKTYGIVLGAEAFPSHSIESLLQFNLSAVGIAAGQVQSATINLYSVSGSAGGLSGLEQDPSTAIPVTVDATAIGGSWNEDTVSYTGGTLTKPDAFGNTVTYGIPATVGGVAGQGTESAVGQWVTIDITSLVQAWLNGTVANNGVLLTSDQWYQNGSNTVGATFASSRAAGDAPFLSIVTAPEPSSLMMIASAAGLAGVATLWRRAAHRTWVTGCQARAALRLFVVRARCRLTTGFGFRPAKLRSSQ